MSRSKWKLPYIDYSLLKNNQNKITNQKLIFSRRSQILPSIIKYNHLLYIYNGKTFIKLKLKKKLIGYKLGSFILTRKKSIFKKKKKRGK